MKSAIKVILALAAILALAPAIYASNTQSVKSPSVTNDSPQVCQFFLSKYTGNLDGGGDTGPFTVGPSCPQESDAYATVYVFVDKEKVASEVVKIPAGETRSVQALIKVGTSYAGKSYRLEVL